HLPTPLIYTLSLHDALPISSTFPYYRSLVSTDINIVMDPKPFPRRFQGRIRSLTSTICNHGTWIENYDSASRGVPKNMTLRFETQLQLRFLVCIPLSCSLIAISCSIREGLACSRSRQSLR